MHSLFRQALHTSHKLQIAAPHVRVFFWCFHLEGSAETMILKHKHTPCRDILDLKDRPKESFKSILATESSWSKYPTESHTAARTLLRTY